MKVEAERKASTLPKLKESRKIEDSGEGFKTTENPTGEEDELYGMIFHAYDGKVKHHSEPRTIFYICSCYCQMSNLA